MAPPAPPISRVFRMLKLNPGEISVNEMDHYAHLEYLVLGNRKDVTENTYDSLEI